MHQHDLFRGYIPPERIAAAYEAADHADRKNGGDWCRLAMRHVIEFVRDNSHQSFLAEDIRHTAAEVPAPPDNRAWGAVVMQASKAGLLRRTGEHRLDEHGSPKPVYEAGR